MTLEKAKISISVNPYWWLKDGKKIGRIFFAFLNPYEPKPQLIKIHNSLDSSGSYGKLCIIKKQGALGNYFCLKMISKLAPQ